MMFETSAIDEWTGSFLTAMNCTKPKSAPRRQIANPPYMRAWPETWAPKIEYVVLIAGIWMSISLAEATPLRAARAARAKPNATPACCRALARKRDRSLPGARDIVITQLSFEMVPTWDLDTEA